MKKKIVLIMLIIISMFSVGCSLFEDEGLVSKKLVTKTVKIERVNYDSGFSYVVPIGDIYTNVSTPSSYDVYLSYEGHEIVRDSKKLYDACKGREGEMVEAEFVEKIYENGNTVLIFMNLK